MTTLSIPAPGPPTPDTRYLELSHRVRAAGLLERHPGSDWRRAAVIGVLVVAGLVSVVLVGDSWWQLLNAAALAVVSAQIGFAAHDTGHRQSGRSRRANDVAGLVTANLLLGMSFGWWSDKHNRHHAHPNQEELDPDIGTGVFVWSAGQARARRGLGRTAARYQAVFFFPMLLLEAVHLHVASVSALPRRPAGRRTVEGVLMGLHLILVVGALFLLLSPLLAVAFLAVHQALLGLLLGSAFAPNHKGMPVFGRDERHDFLDRQVVTARNVRGGPVVDFALGGLNYQIEHHLFPSMPRRNLRRCRPIVRDFCTLHGLPYDEVPLIRSYLQVLRALHASGAGRTLSAVDPAR